MRTLRMGNVGLPEGGTRCEDAKERGCLSSGSRQADLQADSSVLLIDIQN